MRDLSIKAGLLLLLALGGAYSVLYSYVGKMAMPDFISGIDLLYYYYRLLPPDLYASFKLLECSVLALPFAGSSLLTAVYLSSRVLSLSWYTLPRFGRKRRWLVYELKRMLFFQSGYLILFNLLLFLLIFFVWGVNADSMYHSQYFVGVGYGLAWQFPMLVLRQIGLMTALCLCQVYLALRFQTVVATLATLLWCLLQVFMISLGVFTPFHLGFSPLILSSGSISLALLVGAWFFAACLFVLLYWRINAIEFSRGE